MSQKRPKKLQNTYHDHMQNKRKAWFRRPPYKYNDIIDLSMLGFSKLKLKKMEYDLWNTDTPRVRRVLGSDTCRVRHRHNTDTCNYTGLCDFFKLL